jgi:hypothetical protein
MALLPSAASILWRDLRWPRRHARLRLRSIGGSSGDLSENRLRPGAAVAVRPGTCLHSCGDADLRVRVHGVREPLRGAAPPRRGRSELPRVRVGEDESPVLRVRDSRHRRAAELRRNVRRRMLRRKLWLRLTARPGRLRLAPLTARCLPGIVKLNTYRFPPALRRRRHPRPRGLHPRPAPKRSLRTPPNMRTVRAAA